MFYETLVDSHLTTRRYILGNGIFHIDQCENLKFNTQSVVCSVLDVSAFYSAADGHDVCNRQKKGAAVRDTSRKFSCTLHHN
jgi:hypothetical protein